jgi:ATP/maltotriose-dependent transcriptional regulator MalT
VPAKVRAAQRAGNRFVEVSFRTHFVNLHLVPNRPDEARRDIDDAMKAWPRGNDFGNQDYLAVRNRTYVAMYAGDLDAAIRLLPRWEQYFGSLMARVDFLRQDALWFIGAIAAMRARAAHDAGRPSEQRTHLREAARIADRLAAIAMPMAQGKLLQLRAAIALASGDLDAARARIREAMAMAEARSTDLERACAQWTLADLEGGDAGLALHASAEAWFTAEGIRAPARFVAAVFPGRS